MQKGGELDEAENTNSPGEEIPTSFSNLQTDVTSTDNWATSVIGKTDASITGRNGKPYRALMKAKRLL